ncbi:MAG: hypothetical protein ACO1TE_13715 [Prosthecobacter sp.]
MSARDLAAKVREEMRMLSIDEQARFLGMVSSMRPAGVSTRRPSKPLMWEGRQKRLKQIFGDKVLPKNLVLEERESYAY